MASTSTTSTGGLSLSGLASGINWTSIVDEMLTIEAAPETQMQTEENTDNQKNSGLQNIGTQLTTLSGDLKNLSNPTFFGSRTTSLSNPSIGSATAATGTPLGNYSLTVSKLASDSVQLGQTNISAPLNSSNNVSSLVLSSAGFATPVTAGTFTVNGQSISITTGETLQAVFNQISTATGGAVTGTYSSTTDEITLSSGSPIVLGSDTDTSNFLQAAELYNNGTGTVTSASTLGGINLNDDLNSANFKTTVTDGGSGNGEFMINGVAIKFNASTDTVNDVLQAINNSSAGVTATYNSLDNQFELTNDTTGDVGISLQDVTGNFLAASGLLGGTLQQGSNLKYSINNGSTMQSQSNTVNLTGSGISGLSFTAQGEGTTTVSVQSDTSTISAAINSFVTDYNAVQSYISTQTATTTSSTGTVTPGLFTGNLDVENIATTLRQMTDATPASGTPGYASLNEIGIASNGNDNTLSVNSTTLDSALTNNLSAVEDLFTNSTDGIATTLNNYLGNQYSGTGVLSTLNGVLSTDEANYTQEAQSLANSITTLQQKITNDQTKLTNEFTNMETSINSINQEKAYLSAYLGGSSSSAAPTAAGGSYNNSASSSSSDSSSSGSSSSASLSPL